MKKKILIVANWKMNPPTSSEAEKLFAGVKKLDAVICPPFCYLDAKIWSSGAKFTLGAQNCHWEEKGAYTGEISPKMLKSMGVKYVIIGHSERRAHFKETDEMINKKLKAALKFGLIPILCIGEKKDKDAEIVVDKQLKEDLNGIIEKDVKKIVIAYEPVWAIGTGNFCDSQKAKKALRWIQEKTSNKVLYGGSVNSKISTDYTKVGFDGLLVGGASLNAEEFIKIVKNAQH
ncbi:MAG: triose-phosphate isomerase [bacterium]|nr:triose-phosphate isomerase [bacterium]